MSNPNGLINEKSPYLLQHAYNPVNWYPWSDEAFQKAKAEEKPVFLSIGYSTCRWCHNMARESFKDKEIASILNENFVSIKVDREELPHVDRVYMSVCEGLTGQGGWPLTVFMTPDKTPFFAGTYFPKENMGGRIGFKELITRIITKWNTDKISLEKEGEKIAKILASQLDHVEGGKIDESLFEKSYSELKDRFDPQYGGFAKSPKFPMPSTLLFLLRYVNMYEKDDKAASMIKITLDGMYKGGLFDHLGGGFYRYSVDNRWLVPHFEKMLYDNALLALAYLEAYQWSRDELYKEVAVSTLEFLEREMLDKNGAFYTAIDAESEGEEGKFYLWSYDEILEVLGEKKGKEFNKFYGVTDKGNFEGKNILNRLNETEKSESEVRGLFKDEIEKLFKIRETNRIKPNKDDKILTSLNALAVVCFSKASRILNEDRFLKIAGGALDFVLENLIREEDGRVLVRYRDKEAAFLGNIEDYAYLAWAMLEYYQVSFEKKYFNMVKELIQQAEKLFKDDKSEAFSKYGNDEEKLFARPIELIDLPSPSGNSVMLYVIVRLGYLEEDEENKTIWNDKARKLIESCGGSIEKLTAFSSFFLIGIMNFLKPPTLIKFYKSANIPIKKLKTETMEEGISKQQKKIMEFLEKINSYYIPDVLLNFLDEKEDKPEAESHTEDIYVEVCKGFSCKGTIKTPEELKDI